MAATTDYDARASFDSRVATLPTLGTGISTEYGASAEGLDVLALAEAHGDVVRFLEIGADLERGVDEDARAWVASGRPVTYHFLDVNLEDDRGPEEDWIDDTAVLARELRAAWLCGDAGLWHVGIRDRGHGILMPPVLVEASADVMADNVRRVRERSGLEVLPENPPANVYVGDMHLLDYFARVADRADSGLLLDVAHLAIYQRVCGHAPLTAMDGFPLDRVVEVHVAGSSTFESDGREFVDDDHGTEILDDTWELYEHVAAHAPNLRAVVFECERNSIEAVVPGFERLAGTWTR